MFMNNATILWSGYTTVLGFLIVFRNNQAYSRFWEGAERIMHIRSEWINAASCLMAFSSREEQKTPRVQEFQQLIVRLMSLLHCHALHQLSDFQDGEDVLPVLDLQGVERQHLQFLQTCEGNRAEVVLQWIQRLIVEAHEDGLLIIAPPILSRIFQELGNGIKNLNACSKIADIPFPFPYAQMITAMLCFHWVVTPCIAASMLSSGGIAACMSFLVTSGLWALQYISLEIDQPFGDDANDLPVLNFQKRFNCDLLLLLEPLSQTPPTFDPQTIIRTGSFRSILVSGSRADLAFSGDLQDSALAPVASADHAVPAEGLDETAVAAVYPKHFTETTSASGSNADIAKSGDLQEIALAPVASVGHVVPAEGLWETEVAAVDKKQFTEAASANTAASAQCRDENEGKGTTADKESDHQLPMEAIRRPGSNQQRSLEEAAGFEGRLGSDPDSRLILSQEQVLAFQGGPPIEERL
eukprot:TRINITY_DN6300_c0_g1_i2.p1 TRINITY_DN6300_c0_g1~~TRINITY_DN6300_c0_g1_i2.p1  ORF type:complete len:469 (+),score=72.32 TRINITY_DN6300_c0_g1_i2:140-1546(+)